MIHTYPHGNLRMSECHFVQVQIIPRHIYSKSTFATLGLGPRPIMFLAQRRCACPDIESIIHRSAINL